MISFCICVFSGSILINFLGFDDALVFNAWNCRLIKVVHRGFIEKTHFLFLNFSFFFSLFYFRQRCDRRFRTEPRQLNRRFIFTSPGGITERNFPLFIFVKFLNTRKHSNFQFLFNFLFAQRILLISSIGDNISDKTSCDSYATNSQHDTTHFLEI